MEEIFEHVNETLTSKDKLYTSFEGCPNNCDNGWIFNPYTHKRSLCSYCEQKRKHMVSNKATIEGSHAKLSKLLNISDTLLGTEFDFDTVIPIEEQKMLQPTTVTKVRDIMKSLMQSASNGDELEESVMINTGARNNNMNFISAFMRRYYISGKTVAPLLTVPRLCTLRREYELCDLDRLKDNDIIYTDFINADVCVVIADSGINLAGVNAIRGLMQLRRLEDKATVVMSDSITKYMLELRNTTCIPYKHLARYYTVDYIQSAEDKTAGHIPSFKMVHMNVNGEINPDDYMQDDNDDCEESFSTALNKVFNQ